MNQMKKGIELLVEKLPEQYQQIFSYSNYDSSSSRDCDFRLYEILKIYRLIKKQLKRELRVLDLGCAQGYFSLSLVKEGAFVCGVDCNQENINLCNKLSNIHNLTNVEFKEDKIQNFLRNNPLKEYDLVLGLSVFHHICYEEGYQFTQNLIKETAEVIPNGIYELALSSEPMYWAESLNENEEEILDCYSFVNLITTFETHLSKINRPVYYASNEMFLFESFAANFDTAFSSSHAFEDNTHNNTRKYFKSKGLFIKHISFEKDENKLQNKGEFENEVKFLENEVLIENKPKLKYKFENEKFGIIARDLINGEILYNILTKLSFDDKKRIVLDLLSQLIILEKNGLFHNDLRVWNIIVNQNNNVSLIDYGAITESSKDCEWPSNVFHSFIVLVIEIFSEDYSHINPTRKLDLTKLHHLRELQLPATKTLLEKPEKLSFEFIYSEFSKSCFNNNILILPPLIYEQNQSLNLHIGKLFQVKNILRNILFGRKKDNLQIDSLLRNIQDLFYKKNNYIVWLEEVNNEVSLKNKDLKKIVEENEQQIKSLTEQYKNIIIEKNLLSQKYKDLSIEKTQQLEELNHMFNLTINLQDKLYKVHFTKHLYRAWKRISGAKKYNL